jgi:DNA-binding transcriptional ArsR family regulator
MKNAIFIHSNLDEWGLRPHPYRVICHVARRGECFGSVCTIAEICRMHADTVRKALKELVNAGLLIAQYRQGMTTIYRVDHQRIINGPPRKEGSTPYEKQGDPPSTNKGVHPSGNKGGDPYENEGDKVYPIKVIPLRNTPPRGNGLSKNVQLIDLGKAMKQLEDEADEYKGVHRGEAAGGEYHWDKGTREIWQAKRKETKELRLRAEALRMD